MHTPFKITIKASRESHGYTIQEVAKCCGISNEQMAAYEADSGHTPAHIGIYLMRLYSIPLDYIHWGKDEDCFNYNRGQAEARAAEWAAMKKEKSQEVAKEAS